MGNFKNLIHKWEKNHYNYKNNEQSNADILRRKIWPFLEWESFIKKWQKGCYITSTEAAMIYLQTWPRKYLEKTTKRDSYGMGFVMLFARKFLVNVLAHLIITLWVIVVFNFSYSCGLTLSLIQNGANVISKPI